ncbi:MAG: efflux transporter outer membrane subunit [Verrucomicrobiota bacterium]
MKREYDGTMVGKVIFGKRGFLGMVAVSLFAAALLLCLSSCVGGRGNVSQSSRVELGESFSESGDAEVPAYWWEEFDDGELDLLMERALSENLELRAAWKRLDEARAVASREGSGLWPSADASGSAARSVRRSEPVTGGEIETRSSNQFQVGLTVSYVVDIWGKIRAGRDSARLAAEASAQDVRATELALSAQVAGAWYRLCEQYGQLELLAEQVESSEKTLELVEMRFRKGQVSATDVLRQRELLESVRTERAGVESAAASLRHQLAVLTGQVPAQVDLPRRAKLPGLPRRPDTGSPRRWVQHRPDIQSAYHRLLSLDRSVAVALADRYPAFRLNAEGESAVPTLSDLLEQWAVSLGGSVAAPIFSGGRREAEVDRARAALAEAVEQYGQAILEGVREVEDALSAESAQKRTIAGLERQLELAGRTLEQLRERYRNGTVAFIEVLEAEQSVQSLQRRLLEARRNLIERRIDLYAALGGGEIKP